MSGMSGMTMMLKSFGFDPELLKAQLTQAQQLLTNKVNDVDSKLTIIQDSLLRLEIKFNTLPEDNARKLLAENSAEAIAELERIYGRNHDNNSDGNNGDGRESD